MKNLSIVIALDEKALDEWMKNRAAPRKMKKILGNLALDEQSLDFDGSR